MNGTTPTEASTPIDPESFAALFEESIAHVEKLKEGDIVCGTVIKVGRDAVVIDIGYKSEGVISMNEFHGPAGKAVVNPGDKVDVLVESMENDDGLVALSKEKADKLKVWDEISAACERDELIVGTITARVKGGLSVTINGGVKAFLPGSQVDLRPIRNLDKLIGQNFEFKVIKFNKKRGNIVLSRRVLLEKERDRLKAATLQNLEEGQIVTGIIKNLTEYGAFVDLGGIDGLLHITDMSWGRVSHPSELFSVGDEVTVKVLKYNAETERVSLGLKQITEDPWNAVIAAFPIGTKVKGKVVSITDYGAFIEMDEGVEGLIHVSEMSWKKPKHPSKLVEVGEEVECIVLDVDVQNKRISLGLKQLQEDPWTAFTQKYNPGDIIRGKVRSITDYGVFIGIEDGVDGMVHKSDLSWTQRINNPADLYHKGDEVEAIILSVNDEEKKVSLGIKQLYEDPWSYIPTQYPVGTILEVRTMSVTEYGVFVEIERGVEGLVPRSEISHEFVEDPAKFVNVGDQRKAELISIDATDRKITLSFKDVEDRELDQEAMKFQKESKKTEKRKVGPSGTTGATLGDVLKAKLGNIAPAPSSAPAEAAEAGAEAAEEATEATAAEAGAEATEEATPEATPEATEEAADKTEGDDA
ncbi:MAG: 30S ribosomal protein S1 [Deltaproteobacteria bacterium]|nr:30S ribosomal protein S1 [Deltaproteobacteria bacterium]